MGRGRSPCCDKALVKKGPWSQAEDLRLISFIQKHGHDNWRALPKQAGLLRCGKSCRLRWINYLRPDIKRGNFSQDEEELVIKLHEVLGNKWSKIASHLPGRTDNEIKNVWHTNLKKRLIGKGCNTGASASDGSELKHSLDPHQQPSSVLMSNGSLGQVLDQTSPPTVTEAREQPSSSSNSCSSSHDDQATMPMRWAMPDMLPPPSFFFFETKGDLGSVNAVEDNSNTEKVCEKVIEIPFEPNLDFWDMLDADSNVDSDEVPMRKGLANQDTISQETNGEVESGRWLAYLEDALGLETTTGFGSEENSVTMKDAAEPQLAPTLSNQVILSKYQMWLAS